MELKRGNKMNKFLETLDKLTTASLPAMAVTTILLIIMKLLGYVSYGWLVAFSPALIAVFLVGLVNFFSFYWDQE
jgi:hypothetical protein